MSFSKPPNEGDIYKTVTVAGKTFVLRYGYYSDTERDGEPMPILPDFEKEPHYDEQGNMCVTRIQDSCAHYAPRGESADGWCADCRHYPDEKEDIGVCQCEHNKQTAIK